jgi:hypothetical protein
MIMSYSAAGIDEKEILGRSVRVGGTRQWQYYASQNKTPTDRGRELWIALLANSLMQANANNGIIYYTQAISIQPVQRTSSFDLHAKVRIIISRFW